MAEKYITEEEKNKILQKSAMVLPDSPSASGMKPAQIKKFFYDYIGDFIDTINSKLAEVDFTEEEKKSFISASAGTGLKYDEKTGKIEADYEKILQDLDASIQKAILDSWEVGV